jgi:hypothetical protein
MATDQEIRDAGFKYIPQQKYLQNPFQIPTTDDDGGGGGGGGIPFTNAFTGGGDNFSVYNADPNTITNMNPNMYALQDARRNNELSYVGKSFPGNIDPLYSTNTAAMKNMEMYPDYYGMDTIGDRFELDEKGQLVMDSEGNYIRKNQPSKISELIGKGIGFIPGIGTLSKFADFASGMLPANRRAVMENQLGTQGVMVNDIGQIVVGPGGQYNTPEGIMAGYNPAKMTDETFTKRQDVMRNTLDQKYDLSKEQIDGLIAGTLTKEEMEEVNKQAFNKTLNRPSDIITKIRNTEIARRNFGDATGATDQIVDIKTDTKTNNQNQGGGDDGGGSTPIGPGGTGSRRGDSDIPDRNRGGYATDDTASFFAKGGRAGYFYGGRVSVMKGGLASLL